MLEYMPVAEAVQRGGLRLVVTQGVPGPWGEAAKAIFHVKGLSFAPVAQLAGGANEELVGWTGQDMAPVAMYEQERPRGGWLEILLLAERLMPTPALIPDNEQDRAHMLGLCLEICGEDGLGWHARHLIFNQLEAGRVSGALASAPDESGVARMSRKFINEAIDTGHSVRRIVAILDLLGSALKEGRSRGGRYFMGDRLTALDIYWATFSNMVSGFSVEVCPMPQWYRDFGTATDPAISAALLPSLIQHRDAVMADHFKLPLCF